MAGRAGKGFPPGSEQFLHPPRRPVLAAGGDLLAHIDSYTQQRRRCGGLPEDEARFIFQQLVGSGTEEVAGRQSAGVLYAL